MNTGRFFVALGNHDWRQTDARPNKDYFQGIDEPHPAGPVEVFVVDTNQVSKRNYDPDGEVKNPPDLLPQAPEVAKALNDSAACWKILYMHHPAFSQGLDVHGKVGPLVREFATAVATSAPNEVDAMVAGHIHAFEYLQVPGATAVYFVNGKGGGVPHKLYDPVGPAMRMYHKDGR